MKHLRVLRDCWEGWAGFTLPPRTWQHGCCWSSCLLCDAIVFGGLTQKAEEFDSAALSDSENHPAGGTTRHGQGSHKRAHVGLVVGSLSATGKVWVVHILFLCTLLVIVWILIQLPKPRTPNPTPASWAAVLSFSYDLFSINTELCKNVTQSGWRASVFSLVNVDA